MSRLNLGSPAMPNRAAPKSILMVYPEFPRYSFWNYKEPCHLAGVKHPASPLGLITVAALLPPDWDIKLVDMNTSELRDADIDWADLVFIGGMLPQQIMILRLIDRVHARGKKVVIGGPDPTSQPDKYRKADFLVLGEAETTITPFLAALERGEEKGIFQPSPDRPDITKSPIPRFDLLELDDYLVIGIQCSRGCPFNCEFCDIIELYGRKVRSKTPGQVVDELDALYNLGYRGQIDFVDDNFIGNNKKTKEIIRAVAEWSKPRRHPFFFSTEASINLADDDEMIALFKEINLRHVFIGIETIDEEILRGAQKRQNTSRSLLDNIKKLNQEGMVVHAGFIVGFDNETSAAARAIAGFIEQSAVCIAMVGLLYALPNTQLTRRLHKEGRYLEQDITEEAITKEMDQTTSGLNFITIRPRQEILDDFLFTINKIYSKKAYFDRCLKLGLTLRMKNKHKITLKEHSKRAPAFFRIVNRLGFNRETFYYFWRNFFLVLLRHPRSIEEVVNMMTMYVHLAEQTRHVTALLGRTAQAK